MAWGGRQYRIQIRVSGHPAAMIPAFGAAQRPKSSRFGRMRRGKLPILMGQTSRFIFRRRCQSKKREPGSTTVSAQHDPTRVRLAATPPSQLARGFSTRPRCSPLRDTPRPFLMRHGRGASESVILRSSLCASAWCMGRAARLDLRSDCGRYGEHRRIESTYPCGT